ncbi:ABC transporter substrate-binding protein [Oxalobacteraceae bacterium R-40]|uniref:ABC transporter substrate-binding protein n=1 Tax=Keguizhuia sedimenti TaxID=3064264 RepID=A0ABU1BRW7_9BURK|nr:ABC transporter substrate-binding protein [Oxalobacteraceae bacterium R-40]
MKRIAGLAKIFLAICMACCASAYAEVGVTSNSIVIGQSAALSGPAMELGNGMRDGAMAYFEHVNNQGGVFGRKIILKSLDDGYEADRAAANTKHLIEKEGAFSLFGYVGTPTSNAALAAVNQARIPFFAPFTGASSLRDPFNRNVFNIRASYMEETEKIIEHIATLTMTRVAVFYQNDAYGKAGLEGVTRALKKRNLEVVSTATVERNSTDVAEAVNKIKASNPQAVVMISAYTSCAEFIKAMLAQDSHPLFWNISFVGSQALANKLGKDARGVLISQVMPAPWNDITLVAKEYKKLYAKDSSHLPDYVSLEGYVAAKIFVEGLRRAGPNLTRENFIKALESQPIDAGGFRVKFDNNNHNGSSFVDLTVIAKDGRFLR